MHAAARWRPTFDSRIRLGRIAAKVRRARHRSKPRNAPEWGTGSVERCPGASFARLPVPLCPSRRLPSPVRLSRRWPWRFSICRHDNRRRCRLRPSTAIRWMHRPPSPLRRSLWPHRPFGTASPVRRLLPSLRTAPLRAPSSTIRQRGWSLTSRWCSCPQAGCRLPRRTLRRWASRFRQ